MFEFAKINMSDCWLSLDKTELMWGLGFPWARHYFESKCNTSIGNKALRNIAFQENN